MLDILWAGMLLTGILYGALTGNMNEVTDAALSSAKEAVSLCITMAGIVAMWVGVMQIARSSGLVDRMTKGMQPLLRFLFPWIPKEHRAMEFISANMIANFLGTWVGGNPLWSESYGRAWKSGRGEKTGQGFGNCAGERHCQQ